MTGSKTYVFARIKAFGLDPNKPLTSSSIDSGCSISRCSLCSIDGGVEFNFLSVLSAGCRDCSTLSHWLCALESWEQTMWYHWLWCLCNPSWKQYWWYQEPIRAFGLDRNKPSPSSSIDSGCSISRCSLCSIDGGVEFNFLSVLSAGCRDCSTLSHWLCALESWQKTMWSHWLWCLCNPSWKQYWWYQEPIRVFGLDRNKPSPSSSVDSGCSISRCSLCSIDWGSRVQLLVSTVCWMSRLFNTFSLTVSIGVLTEGYVVSLIVMLV